MVSVGVGLGNSGDVAHYSSVYADHPNIFVLAANNELGDGGRYPQPYYPGIDYSNTKNSQETDYDPVKSTGYNYNIWHAMRSNEEAKLGTISEEGAMRRGQRFGWNMIFGSAREGKISDFKKNDTGLQMLGQGLHALQDSYAHEGTDMKHHDVRNDIYGDTSRAEKITASAVFVHIAISKDTKTVNKLIQSGANSLDLSGISGKNLKDLYSSLKEQGKELKYNWNTKEYEVN